MSAPRALGWLLALGTPVFCVVRALTQPIVVDEAMTWVLYVLTGWDAVFGGWEANHHVLFTYLARLSCSAFGSSEIAMRLPTLAAAFGFAIVARALCTRLFGAGWLAVLVLALLLLNPATLDYLSLARGYGLALALQLATVHVAVGIVTRATRDGDARATRGAWLWLSVLSALSVLANLTWAMPAAGLAVATLALVWHATRRDGLRPLGALLPRLVLPGLGVLLLLGAPLRHAKKGHFWAGFDSLAESWRDCLSAGLLHRTSMIHQHGDAHAHDLVLDVAAGVLLAVLAGVVALALVRARALRASRAPLDAHFVQLTLALVLTLAAIVASHVLAGARWPADRTALHLAPVLALVLGLACAELRADGGVARGTGRVLLGALLALLARFVVQLPDTAYHAFRFNADSRAVFDRLGARAAELGRPLRIAVQVEHVHVLSFYWLSRAAPWVADLQLYLEPDKRFDAYVVMTNRCSAPDADGVVTSTWPMTSDGTSSIAVRMRPLARFPASATLIGVDPR